LGCAGVPDNAEGVEFIKKAAAKKVTEAKYALGVMYATGAGVAQDVALSRHWYGEAARAGNTTAQFKYGFMLLLGKRGPVVF
jgi:TPR repeat protein